MLADCGGATLRCLHIAYSGDGLNDRLQPKDGFGKILDGGQKGSTRILVPCSMYIERQKNKDASMLGMFGSAPCSCV